MDELLGRVAGRFARVETRRGFAEFVTGMLAQLPRTNCWSIAEHAGHRTPDRMQHLLARAVWDTDGVAADVRGWAVEHLGAPDAVLVVDETGDVKKGERTVGASAPSACSASTPGRPGGSRTPRSRSGWPMPAGTGTR